MKMTLEAKLSEHDGYGRIATGLTTDAVEKKLIPVFYFAMLKAMRDTYTRDFYRAMAIFMDGDIDEMRNFFEGGEEDD